MKKQQQKRYFVVSQKLLADRSKSIDVVGFEDSEMTKVHYIGELNEYNKVSRLHPEVKLLQPRIIYGVQLDVEITDQQVLAVSFSGRE